MIFEQIAIGGDRNFAYLAGDKPGGSAVVFDPSYNPRAVYNLAGEMGLTIQAIAVTHDHPDHTNGNPEMKKLTGAEVWPGHDYGVKPASTVGEERKTNPFLVQPDFASFVGLKKNWLHYKKEHGIK